VPAEEALDVIAILVGPKGRGSNMVALARAADEGRVPARVGVVVSPLDGTPAVENALAIGLHLEIVAPEPLDTYGQRLLGALHHAGAQWVCLAGYTRLLPQEVLRAYPNHVLNIHPALLPKYGGKGMYGMRVHEAVLGSDDTDSGCSVHFVNEQYDEGAVILQRRVPRLPGDTPEDLAKRVLEQEHIAYAEALAKLIHESRN
jgi:formyltetrahydrofolate-dependent phosphoribosylglycinamide formyltransferase